jgi:hypothetical protein
MSIENGICWSQLTTLQKEQGIHPKQAVHIQFDFKLNQISQEQLKQIGQFFLGCRAAAPDDSFRARFIPFLNSEKEPKPIKDIVKRVMSMQMPKEIIIEAEKNDLTFSNVGHGAKYRNYEEKFICTYNSLIEQNQEYLMHPSRREELVARIRNIFKKAEMAADHLITYRCFGSEAVRIFDYERGIQNFTAELDTLNHRNNELEALGPKIINPMELQERDLNCIEDECCRKHVCLVYKLLAINGNLELLDLSEEKLYQEGRSVHPDLAEFAKAYRSEDGLIYHFGVVVRHMKNLRGNDIHALQRCCLKTRMESLERVITHYKYCLEECKQHYKNQIILIQNSKSFKKGDFSFIKDPITMRIVTNAYNAVEKLGVWSFFDMDPPEDRGYMFWNHFVLNQLQQELDSDEHTGASKALVMRWMQKIRRQGWDGVVQEYIEESRSSAGLLNRAWAKFAAS